VRRNPRRLHEAGASHGHLAAADAADCALPGRGEEIRYGRKADAARLGGADQRLRQRMLARALDARH
jgi:hypothetical protein